MPYDLTTVLTTIAAASASIVAILGGFIASKLIAISSERSAAWDRLRQINEELEFHIAERDKIQAKNDESDALDFIQTAIDDLWAGNSLENVYSNVDHPDISIECLKPYWDRAVILKEQFQEQVKKQGQLNGDYIPTSLIFTVREDNFGYEILRALGKKLKKRIRAAERAREKASNPFGLVTPDIGDYEFDTSSVSGGGYAYHKNCEAIQEESAAIALLELQEKQCTEQIQALKKPRGMKSGLVIFALFTVFCIIVPLAFSPFSVNSYLAFIITKIVFLVLFSVGLLAIFSYLTYLLKWDDNH
ncbi:MAG: hypothetical protein UF405_02355 [Acutalibacteraceae bacterium]|nr:hypothetical protein [Acutalibacteraceae bacterium]